MSTYRLTKRGEAVLALVSYLSLVAMSVLGGWLFYAWWFRA